MLKWKKGTLEEAKKNLELTLGYLQTMGHHHFTAPELQSSILDWIKKENLDTGGVLWPLRAALTGKKNSPGPFDALAALGEERGVRRIKEAIDKLKT